MGFSGGLIDSEGFPRTDIDIVKIRTFRHEHSCLQNDHSACMKEIEEYLLKFHEVSRSLRDLGTDVNKITVNTNQDISHSPFLHSDSILNIKTLNNETPIDKLKRVMEEAQLLCEESCSPKTFISSVPISDSSTLTSPPLLTPDFGKLSRVFFL
jgi:hypothetical protein